MKEGNASRLLRIEIPYELKDFTLSLMYVHIDYPEIDEKSYV